MKNSELSSKTKSSEALLRRVFYGTSIVSIIGFLDASYLTTKYYLGTPLNCSVFEGCELVTTSQYATIFAIPVALLGAFYYLLIFILSFMYLDAGVHFITRMLPPLTLIGFFASVWFVYLQLFVIRAICIYCMGSAASSTILLIMGLAVIKSQKVGGILKS